MKIQEIVSDVRGRAEAASKQSQDAFAAYLDAQKKAFGVVTKNGQSLANTEIDAARNVFAAARSSFDQARKDGVRQVASEPKSYVPFDSRDEVVSAYKSTIDLLVQTGNELTDIVTDGYRTVRSKLTGKPAPKKKVSTSKKSNGSQTKPAARKTTTQSKSSSASGSKSTASKSGSTAKSSSASKSTAKSSSSQSKSSQSKSGQTQTKQSSASKSTSAE